MKLSSIPVALAQSASKEGWWQEEHPTVKPKQKTKKQMMWMSTNGKIALNGIEEGRHTIERSGKEESAPGTPAEWK